MTEFSAQELAKVKEERGLNSQQLNALQKAAYQYGDHLSKQELIDTFRKLGYMPQLLEQDL